jgi:hypothetical protein
MNIRIRPSWKTALPVLLVVLAVIAAACSGSNDEVTSPAAQGASSRDSATKIGEEEGEFGAPTPDVSPAPSPEAPQSPGEDLGSGGVKLASLQTINLGRDIIFRADLIIAVTDVAAAGAEATTVVEALGGFLFGQQTTGGGQPRSILTFKILPDNFQAALEALGNIGEIRTQNISADDVTDRVVDLESRISTAEASVVRLREFLDEANDIVTIAELERELLNRETTLETLRGQLRTLEDQVALATIIVTLTEADIDPDMHVAVSTYFGHEDAGQSCPGDGDSQYIEGDKVTVCFEIFNTGDTPLADFTLRDSVLDVELADLTLVFGDYTLLEPGQSVVLAAEIVVERDLRTQTRVTAEPVKEETGELIANRQVSTTETSFIIVEDEGGLPGFSDGLSASWDLMQNIGGLVVLGAGSVLPFLWLVVLVGVYLYLRRRKAGESSTTESIE